MSEKMEKEFENLQQILTRQIALAQVGRIDEVEELLKQADSAITLHTGVREVPESIYQLYNRLCLILKANMAGIKTSLKNSEKNRLAARTYRRNS